MKRLIFILIIIIINSCTILKNNNTTMHGPITIYGKIWDTCCKDAGIVYTPERYRILNSSNKRKVDDWPDSMQYMYVKVTGLLEINKSKLDTSRMDIQYNYIKYFIIKPQIEMIHNDSIICAIDSVMGRCVEMRRFYNRLQIDKVLDTLVERDSVFTVLTDFEVRKPITATYFKYKGSKTIFHYSFSLLRYEKIPEYFVIRNFSCIKDSEYNIELTHVNVIGGIKVEKKYHLTGNSDKINIIPIL